MPSFAQTITDQIERFGWRSREELLGTAAMYVRWAEQEYHAKFIEWLDEQADAPVKIDTDSAAMIASFARVNTFKEIRGHLLREEERARQALEREQHGG